MKYPVNTLSLQKDILSALDRKANKNEPLRWYFMPYDEPTAVYVGTGQFLFRIPEDLFYLHDEIVEQHKINGEKFFDSFKDTYKCLDTKTEKITQDGVTVRIFECQDGKDLWVNTKYLKYLRSMDFEFYATNYKSPLFVKSYNQIIGIIMPINHN